MQHPDITRIERTGYINMMEQPEHMGVDYFGDEILIGDDVVVDPNNDEVILKDNVEKYLADIHGFEFKTME